MDASDRVERIFRDSLAIEVPSPTTDVIANGLLDSLALVMLLFEVEQAFDIEIPLDGFELESLRTIERIAAFAEGIRAAT
jgi:acyl carrier protein